MSVWSIGQRMQKSQASCDILLIEDDEATSEMLTECIQSESSFRVKSLSSGEEALQHLQEIKETVPFLSSEKMLELFSMLIRVDYTGKSCFTFLDLLLYE